jgi:hypothetical protein
MNLQVSKSLIRRARWFFLGTIDKPPVSVGGSFLGWVNATHFIYYPYVSPGEVRSKILLGEISGDTITTYESGISLPAENITMFTFVSLDPKANE